MKVVWYPVLYGSRYRQGRTGKYGECLYFSLSSPDPRQVPSQLFPRQAKEDMVFRDCVRCGEEHEEAVQSLARFQASAATTLVHI